MKKKKSWATAPQAHTEEAERKRAERANIVVTVTLNIASILKNMKLHLGGN